MPKWETRNGKQIVLALYLLQLKRLAGREICLDNGAPKGIPSLSELITLGSPGRFSEILGCLKKDKHCMSFGVS